MGILDVLNLNKTNNKYLKDAKIKDYNFESIFAVALGRSIAVQQAIAEKVIENRNWKIDLINGVINFGEDSFPIQFLGSKSDADNTFLWGWKNINNFPNSMIALPEKIRKYGEAYKIDVLRNANVELNRKVSEYSLAIVASMIGEDVGYYRCPYEGGAAFIAISGLPKEVFDPVDEQRFIDILLKCLNSNYEFDQKLFVESFLMWNNTAYRWDGNTLIAKFKTRVEVEFNKTSQGLRVKNIVKE